uniref:Uncharacterized protein n=1 Tax=Arundo donax TaxID=35708 RepID=A0A0A8Y495_ARUDO
MSCDGHYIIYRPITLGICTYQHADRQFVNEQKENPS